MKIYLVYEDTGDGRATEAFACKDKAKNRKNEILSEYPEHMRNVESLAEENIYIGIDECELFLE